MFSSTIGLFGTPIITTAGMITGVRCDGSYAIQSNPVINMNDFFRPRYETPVYETRSIGDVMDVAEKARERYYEHNKSVSKEIQLNELKAQNAMREENEKKLAIEQAKREAVEKAMAEEREKKLVEERIKREAAEKALAEKLAEEKKEYKLMRKLAIKNLISNTSTISSNKSSRIKTSKSSGMSIDPNEKSDFSNCTRCVNCFNGVSSISCIIVAKNNDDHKIIIGKNVAENAYCDYLQNLKSNGKRSELPSERAEKLIKRLIGIDYDIDQHKFIDIPIKDNLHVHRVYIIDYNSFKTKVTMNITAKYNDIALFSMNTIRANMGLYKNKQIYDSNNNLCNINNRMKKILEKYYKLYC